MCARAVLWLVLALSIATPSGVTAATLLTQNRSVDAWAYLVDHFGNLTQDRETHTAPDFGPFVSNANAGVGFAGASANQSSSVTPLVNTGLEVEATGASSNSGLNMFGDPYAGTGQSSSLFELTFAVDEAAPYELTARVFGSTVTDPFFEQGWIRAWNARVELLEAGGGIVAQLARGSALGDPPAVVDVTQSFAGVLLPGSYTLRALADGWAGGDRYNPQYSVSQSRYEIDFALVPEPGLGALLLVGLAFSTRRRGSPRPVENAAGRSG